MLAEREAIAVAAADSAAALRHVQLEARASWIQRTATFRRGETLADDPEYREALAAAGVGQLEGLALLTEAAAARREGRFVDAIRDATRGAEVMEQTGPAWCVHMCRAVVANVGGEQHPDLASRFDEIAACGVRGVAVQFFGLLVRLDWPEGNRCRRLLGDALDEFPADHEADCMDVMSALECRGEFERTRGRGEDVE